MKNQVHFFLNAYDFSNAFCLWNRRICLDILTSIGFPDSAIRFVHGFLENQSVISTDFNNSISVPEILTVGSTQGQIMSDLLFLIVVNFFRPLLDREVTDFLSFYIRFRYVDDTNDIGSSPHASAIKLMIKRLFKDLESQSKSVALKLNEIKTQIITSIPKSDLDPIDDSFIIQNRNLQSEFISILRVKS